jgi:hypothetical protein
MTIKDLDNSYGERERERNLMLEALPAVTVPPTFLKFGPSFLNFAASN